MFWTPASHAQFCATLPNLTVCQPAFYTFMAFVQHNLGHSYDSLFGAKDIGRGENKDEYDFVIVGGGSAGCVLANRLSEISEWKVLLIEAGQEEPVVADMPGMMATIWGSSIDWKYATVP
ncbi:hypothetical protein QAD02_012334 [Eretmocerus hayati]|uniref:Uncharacterized protein n=1 Tax=Eretmocerus hayati TaxID=131215 RepID=A0ACC2NZG4_9HYME|nr:hypothetical protein QAD02_012334 [Eretmocerus hayati]